MSNRARVIIVSLIITVILFISFPFLLTLTHSLVANYLHKELAYRYISNKVTENSRNDLEKILILNSFIFLNLEQRTPFIDVVDNSVYFGLVRHIGWCDQKTDGLVHLLEKQNIKARLVMFPNHVVAEVWIDNIPRFFDPTLNVYFVYKDDRARIATFEEVLNDNDKLIMSNGDTFSEYGGRAITTYRNYKNRSILIDTKPLYLKTASKIMDFYYYIGGDIFTDVFQDFHFFIMEKFRGGKVVDHLGPIVFWTERMRIEYESETYFDLYKVRSYHLFGNFKKADMVYDNLLDSKDFRDDALFFKTKILLQTKKFSELREHIINVYDEYGDDIAARTGDAEIRYLFFIEHYLEKFCSIEDWQLENIFNFTEPEINEVKTIFREHFNKLK